MGKQQQPTKTSLLSQQKASANSLNNYSNSTPQRYSLVGPLVSLRHQVYKKLKLCKKYFLD